MTSAFERIAAVLERPAAALRAAWSLWLLPLAVISVLLCVIPKHSVTYIYHDAASHWSQRADLYTGPKGFNYLPQFALLFRGFHALPFPAGDIAWRAVSALSVAAGLWRLGRLRFGERAPQTFFWLSLLSIPISLGAMRNGQATVLLTGFMLNAVVSLAENKWWTAAVFATLAMLAKPLALVVAGLAFVIYPAFRWRLIVVSLAALVLPFGLTSPAYVLAQYHQCFSNLNQCAAETPRHFADINAIARLFHLSIPFSALRYVCAAAGVATLIAVVLTGRQTSGIMRAVWLYTYAAIYLMLFNPMNEVNSYVTLAPALAFWAVEFLLRSPETRSGGMVIAAVVATMTSLPNAMRPFFGNEFAMVWDASMTVVFLAVTVTYGWRHAAIYLSPERTRS